MNRREKKFLENIRKQMLVGKSDQVLVTVSGGPDSIALLHLFRAVAPVLKCRLGVAHCNFSLRGEESDQDEVFVREFCRSLDLECHVRRFDTANISVVWKKSIEETARTLRYGFFDELCRDQGYSLVATGHHRGDNAETILFNLFRGASLSGLRGVRAKQGRLIRPLLWFDRCEIMAYLEEKGLAWRTDCSNDGVEYDRNFIRNRVIPVIEERFMYKLAPSLQRMAEHAGELDEFIECHIDRLVKQFPGLDLAGGKLHVGTLRQLTLFERKEILKRALKLQGLSAESRMLERIAALIESQSGRFVQAG
ncbi:MAG: tRNA lysidine(34) synthetase TilS, partial [Chlorobiaceae bacterium]|nr:tRNA lysidine(34) synthetase TilS [Chlorobiaceae bacterium]